MATMMGSVLRAATRGDGPLNILTCPTHESYETNLCKTGHHFYALRGEGIKDWDRSYRPLPANYSLLDPARGDRQLPPDLDFDLVLSQNKHAHALLWQLARRLHLPVLSLEHCLPAPGASRDYLERMKSVRGHANVFISEHSRREWGWRDHEAAVVRHGIDLDQFRPGDEEREVVLLSVVNDWINRDAWCGYRFWREATEGLPVKVLGRTPGLSEPARNVDELAAAYRSAMIFVNTSLVSPVPMALMEAMASGCAVVSTATCMIPEIVSDGENGLLANDPGEMRAKLVRLLGDPDARRFFGRNARRTIEDRFGVARFVGEWDAALRKTANVVFKG